MASTKLTATIEVKAIGTGKIKQVNNELKGLDDGVKKTNKGLGALSKSFGALATGAGIAAAGAAIAKFAKDSIQSFTNFETSISEVFTLLPDLALPELQKISDQALQLAGDINRLPEEVVPALYSAISAGVPPDNVFAFLETANEAALGGVTDLETAVDGITSVMNAYGSEVVSATEASDLLFTAVKLGKTNFEELASGISQVTPIASALGVEFGNVTAALAAITAGGTKTTVAVTQLRSLLVELSKAGGTAANTFERLAGKTFKDFIADGGDLAQALILMRDEANKTGVGINDLFSSVEAGGAALVLSADDASTLINNLIEMDEAAGATGEAAEIMGETAASSFKDARVSGELLKIAIGEGLTPAMLELSDVAADAANNVRLFIGLSRQLAEGVGGVVDEFLEANPTFDEASEFLAEMSSQLGASEKAALIAGGAFGDYKDEMEKVILELAASAGSQLEFNAALEAADLPFRLSVRNTANLFKEGQKLRREQEELNRQERDHARNLVTINDLTLSNTAAVQDATSATMEFTNAQIESAAVSDTILVDRANQANANFQLKLSQDAATEAQNEFNEAASRARFAELGVAADEAARAGDRLMESFGRAATAVLGIDLATLGLQGQVLQLAANVGINAVQFVQLAENAGLSEEAIIKANKAASLSTGLEELAAQLDNGEISAQGFIEAAADLGTFIDGVTGSADEQALALIRGAGAVSELEARSNELRGQQEEIAQIDIDTPFAPGFETKLDNAIVDFRDLDTNTLRLTKRVDALAFEFEGLQISPPAFESLDKFIKRTEQAEPPIKNLKKGLVAINEEPVAPDFTEFLDNLDNAIVGFDILVEPKTIPVTIVLTNRDEVIGLIEALGGTVPPVPNVPGGGGGGVPGTATAQAGGFFPGNGSGILVGERGPELIFPTEPSRILDASTTNNMTPNITINVMGGLASSPQAIAGAVAEQLGRAMRG